MLDFHTSSLLAHAVKNYVLIYCKPVLEPGLVPVLIQVIAFQISMQQGSGSGSLGSDKARTLSTNLDEKIGSLQWRKEVLQRVQKLFEIVVQKVTGFGSMRTW